MNLYEVPDGMVEAVEKYGPSEINRENLRDILLTALLWISENPMTMQSIELFCPWDWVDAARKKMEQIERSEWILIPEEFKHVILGVVDYYGCLDDLSSNEDDGEEEDGEDE